MSEIAKFTPNGDIASLLAAMYALGKIVGDEPWNTIETITLSPPSVTLSGRTYAQWLADQYFGATHEE